MNSEPIPITITKLQMMAKPSLPRAHLRKDQEGGRVMLLKLRKPPLHFYRYLYGTVGRDHVWVERHRMSDDKLQTIIHDDAVEIYVLFVDGAPAGYSELDFRNKGEAELAYFGIMPDYLGRGLGTFLLINAIDTAWSKPISRLWVHTNTLDHPRALPLYQRMGFAPYAQEKAEIVPLG